MTNALISTTDISFIFFFLLSFLSYSSDLIKGEKNPFFKFTDDVMTLNSSASMTQSSLSKRFLHQTFFFVLISTKHQQLLFVNVREQQMIMQNH